MPLNSAPSFSFTSALIGSAARRIALAWKKSSMRKMPMFGRSTRSGANSFSLCATIVCPITEIAANRLSHGSGTP